MSRTFCGSLASKHTFQSISILQPYFSIFLFEVLNTETSACHVEVLKHKGAPEDLEAVLFVCGFCSGR
jgi:hypothetical protein